MRDRQREVAYKITYTSSELNNKSADVNYYSNCSALAVISCASATVKGSPLGDSAEGS